MALKMTMKRSHKYPQPKQITHLRHDQRTFSGFYVTVLLKYSIPKLSKEITGSEISRYLMDEKTRIFMHALWKIFKFTRERVYL